MGTTNITRNRRKNGNTTTEDIGERSVNSANTKKSRTMVPRRCGNSTRRPVISITVHDIPTQRVMDHTKENNCATLLKDDIDLINEHSKSLQEQLEESRAAAAQAGLIINVEKNQNHGAGWQKNRTTNTHCRQKYRQRRQGRISTETNKQLGTGKGNNAHHWDTYRMATSSPFTMLTRCVFSVLLYAWETLHPEGNW